VRPRVDPVAAAAAVLAAAMAAVYVRVMHGQGDEPVAWVLVVLVAGALAAAYGAVPGAPHRRPALFAGGTALVLLGLLAILTIGLPILVAGALAVVAGSRSRGAGLTGPAAR
jgi:hypothetical protein